MVAIVEDSAYYHVRAGDVNAVDGAVKHGFVPLVEFAEEQECAFGDVGFHDAAYHLLHMGNLTYQFVQVYHLALAGVLLLPFLDIGIEGTDDMVGEHRIYGALALSMRMVASGDIVSIAVADVADVAVAYIANSDVAVDVGLANGRGGAFEHFTFAK